MSIDHVYNGIPICFAPYTDCEIVDEQFIDEELHEVILRKPTDEVKQRLMIIDNLLDLF